MGYLSVNFGKWTSLDMAVTFRICLNFSHRFGGKNSPNRKQTILEMARRVWIYFFDKSCRKLFNIRILQVSYWMEIIAEMFNLTDVFRCNVLKLSYFLLTL